jgi:hypothetical protein
MRNKNAQITVFIILGMVLFISLMIGYTIKDTYVSSRFKPHIYTGTSLEAQKDSLNTYVNFCLKDVIDGHTPRDSPILRIARQGGILSNFNNFVEYNHDPDFFTDKINILCQEEEDKGCVQDILTKDRMEKDLSQNIYANFISCLDLNEFEKKGYTIKFNRTQIQINTDIAKDTITTNLYYPIKIISPENTGFTIQLDKWQYKVNKPLGRLYDLAIDIINTEDFNKDEWMINNNAQIIIQKHNPYPDTIYQLSRQKSDDLFTTKKSSRLILQFATKGINTVGQQYRYLTPSLGCCATENYCYKNTEEDNCNKINGTYNQNSDCTCPAKADYTKITQYISDCQNNKHGSSWCSYESISGNGFDYVGNRHYLNTCVDGEVIVEECRDFREELCTQSKAEQKATCRKNRWQDCIQCTTENCCENSQLRDCTWKAYLETDKKCTPTVPPGLKFWEGDNKVCNSANQKTEFRGLTTKQSWIDSTAVLCYSTGDCGNYRNIANKITKDGFRNTDASESEYTYLRDNNFNNDNVAIFLPLHTTEQSTLAPHEQLFKQSSTYPTTQEITLALQKLDRNKIFEEYKEENTPRPALSRCELWNPPLGSDCSRCTDNKADGMVCSEYKCKTLGKDCVFTYRRGIPQCSSRQNIDTIPPKLEIDPNVLLDNYEYEKALFPEDAPLYSGHAIYPNIQPFQLFTFGIKTDEPARCKVTYLPTTNFALLPPIWFGNSDYKTEHNISIRLPRNIELPEDFLQTNTSIIDDATIELLNEIKQGSYHLFIKCNDEFGNENKDNFFIRFKMDTEQNDITPPKIVGTIPRNNSIVSKNLNEIPINIYLNEPSECKASISNTNYENMEHDLSCVSSEYEISSEGSGSYECTSKLPFAEKYFIKCIDQPIPTATFQFIINRTQSNITEEDSKYAKIILEETINKNSYNIITSNINDLKDKVFALDKSINLRFGISKPADCKISNTDVKFEQMFQQFDCKNKQDLNISSDGITQYTNTSYFTLPDLCSTTIDITGDALLHIKCREQTTKQVNRNTATESFEYNLRKSKGLDIVGIEPSSQVDTLNPILKVVTTGDIKKDNIRCTYSNGNDEFSMRAANNIFLATTSTLNDFQAYEYTIKCTNNYGDTTSRNTKFTVIKS